MNRRRRVPFARLAAARVDYEYGTHSGIPRCCVIAWCRAGLHSRRGITDLPALRGVGYRPCPSCAALIVAGLQRPAAIRICDPGRYPALLHPAVLCGCGVSGRWWWQVRYRQIMRSYRTRRALRRRNLGGGGEPEPPGHAVKERKSSCHTASNARDRPTSCAGSAH